MAKPSRPDLKEYHRKRKFASTPEPRGDAAKDAERRANAKALFFCVQKHLASHLHYDFRLEHHGVLLSWAVPKGPSLNPADKRLAMRVEDHPWDYRQFEGVIPEGYGAGIVMLWDQGKWTPEEGFGDIDAALAKGELKFRLDGVKLKGSFVLVRTKGRWGGGGGADGGESRSWLLIKHRDDWAGDVDVLALAPNSVKSDLDFPGILAKKDVNVWESHRPAEGGAAGKLLAQVIEQAKALKSAPRKAKAPKRAVKKGTRPRSSSKS